MFIRYICGAALLVVLYVVSFFACSERFDGDFEGERIRFRFFASEWQVVFWRPLTWLEGQMYSEAYYPGKFAGTMFAYPPRYYSPAELEAAAEE